MWLPGFLNVNTCHFATAIAALLPQVVGLPFDTYFNGEFIQHHIQYRMLQQQEGSEQIVFHFHKGKYEISRVKPQLFSSMKLEAILITDDLVREGGGNGVALWKYKELQLSCQGVAGIAVGITQYRGIITYRLVFTRTSANIENKAEQLIC